MNIQDLLDVVAQLNDDIFTMGELYRVKFITDGYNIEILFMGNVIDKLDIRLLNHQTDDMCKAIIKSEIYTIINNIKRIGLNYER